MRKVDEAIWTEDTTLGDEHGCLTKCDATTDCLSAEWTSTPLVAEYWDPDHLPYYTEEQGACRRVSDGAINTDLVWNYKQYSNMNECKNACSNDDTCVAIDFSEGESGSGCWHFNFD